MIKDPQARIVGKENRGDYYILSLESADIAGQARPGQFLMVRVSSHPYPLLRRPFSIHSRNRTALQVFFQVTGVGTVLLSQKKEGESLDILGPLGKGFTAGADLEGKEVIAAGGGRGIAPFLFLASVLRSQGAKVKIFYGGKTRADLPLRDVFSREGFELFCSTDDGSFGFKGFISDYLQQELDKLKAVRIYACGPEEMMNRIATLARTRQIPAEFSLESVMGCGFGACWGCVRKIRRKGQEEWLKICEEGPVFSGEEIVWMREEKR